MGKRYRNKITTTAAAAAAATVIITSTVLLFRSECHPKRLSPCLIYFFPSFLVCLPVYWRTRSLTYFGLMPLQEHRPWTTLLRTLKPVGWSSWIIWTVFSRPFKAWLFRCISTSASLLHVHLSLSRFLFRCGFQVRACLVMLLTGFLRVWPI